MIINSPYITGSINISGAVTGSLFGTASQATSASYSYTASSATNSTSASYALTASFALNAGGASGFPFTGSASITGSFRVFGSTNISASSYALQILGSGSSVFSVDGTVGRLFQVDDSLSGSLFSVNTTAGLPVIEAFSDNTVRIGQYNQKALFVSQSRVGVGMETPVTNLDVSGSVRITNGLSLTGSLSSASPISASAILTTGTITAQTLVVQTITSSIDFVTGSTRFGSLLTNTHTFTGSVSITGSLTVNTTGTEFQVNNNGVVMGNQLTDAHSITGSLSITGSTTVFAGSIGINGSPGNSFPIESYINSSTTYTSTSRGNVLRVYNSNTTANIYAGIELGGAGASNDGLVGINGIVTAAGSGDLAFYTRNSNTFGEKMRINSSGAVGIGCSPGSIVSLDIQNLSATSNNVFLRLQNNIASEDCGIIISGSFSGGYEYRIGVNTIVASKDLCFHNSNTSGYRWFTDGLQTLTLASNGLLSINNTISSANYKLGVSGSAYINGANNKGIFITDNATYASIVGLNSAISAYNPLELRASGTDYQLYLNTSGNVGIGNIGDTSQKLRVQGIDTSASNYGLVVADSTTASTMLVRNDGYGYLKASAWAYGSDIRLKENISDVQNGIDIVLKMKPKHFDYINGTKDNLGFIAQEIQEIIPQAISEIPDGTLALKTDFLIPYLVKAIQELKATNDDLQAQINELKAI